jgi:hypothetical protein
MNFEVIADHPCGTKVDLYIPSNWSKSKNFNSEESINESSANVIIFTHGGAWVTNSRSDFEFFGREMASRGLVTCILGYRLVEKMSKEQQADQVVPANAYPAAYQDVAAGIEWIYQNIQKFITCARFNLILVGHSAGAHLNGMVVLKDPQGVHYGLSTKAKTNISKMISVEGIYDLKALAESFPTYSEWFLNAAFPPFLCTWFPDLSLCSEKGIDFNLLKKENPLVSFLSIYSKCDELIDAAQSTSFIKFMRSILQVNDQDKRVVHNTSLEDTHDGILKNKLFLDFIFQQCLDCSY